MTPSRIEPATVQLVAQWLNQQSLRLDDATLKLDKSNSAWKQVISKHGVLNCSYGFLNTTYYKHGEGAFSEYFVLTEFTNVGICDKVQYAQNG